MADDTCSGLIPTRSVISSQVRVAIPMLVSWWLTTWSKTSLVSQGFSPFLQAFQTRGHIDLG